VECRGKDTVGTGCLWTIGHLCLGNFRRRLARVYVNSYIVILHKTDSETTSERFSLGCSFWDMPDFRRLADFSSVARESTSCEFPLGRFFLGPSWSSVLEKWVAKIWGSPKSARMWWFKPPKMGHFMDIHLLIMLILAEVVELGLGSPILSPRIDATWAWVPFWGSNGSREVVIVIFFAKMEGFIHFKPCPQCRRPINLRREQSVSRSNTSRRWKVLLRRALTQSSFPKFQ